LREEETSVMRISGLNGAINPAPPNATRRAGASTFSVAEEETTRPANAAASLRTVGGIDALIALQGVEDPTERRRRAVKRGSSALDALDELKLGLLGGALDQATIGKLKAIAAGLKEQTGEAGLDQVLAEIDLRVEVELAKRDLRPNGRG
jgi:hypothetical protein